MLKKELTLYERDGDGKLIPQEVKLELVEEDKKQFPELVGQTIAITPLTRGELKKLFGLSGKKNDIPETDKDDDGKVILEHCHTPKYTENEIAYLKPIMVRTIVRTVFKESGIMFDQKTGKKSFESNDEMRKNSSESNVEKKKDD